MNGLFLLFLKIIVRFFFFFFVHSLKISTRFLVHELTSPAGDEQNARNRPVERSVRNICTQTRFDTYILHQGWPDNASGNNNRTIYYDKCTCVNTVLRSLVYRSRDRAAGRDGPIKKNKRSLERQLPSFQLVPSIPSARVSCAHECAFMFINPKGSLQPPFHYYLTGSLSLPRARENIIIHVRLVRGYSPNRTRSKNKRRRTPRDDEEKEYRYEL
jgi:hypothetical protein